MRLFRQKPFSIIAGMQTHDLVAVWLIARHMRQVRLIRSGMSCVPEALRESVRELMDPADGPNGEKVALSDASDFFTAV
jgi:hypothetical protein